MKHDQEWLIENINAAGSGKANMLNFAEEYAEHMTAKLQARVDELEIHLQALHDDWFEHVKNTCRKYGLSEPVKKPHPLLADKEAV